MFIAGASWAGGNYQASEQHPDEVQAALRQDAQVGPWAKWSTLLSTGSPSDAPRLSEQRLSADHYAPPETEVVLSAVVVLSAAAAVPFDETAQKPTDWKNQWQWLP